MPSSTPSASSTKRARLTARRLRAPAGPRKKKRAVGRQLALRVLADVAAVLDAAAGRRGSGRRAASGVEPGQRRLAALERRPVHGQRGRGVGRARRARVRTPAWNAASSVEATTFGSARTAGASSAGVERDERERLGAGAHELGGRVSPRQGSTWCASSMMSQCGRPGAERTAATAASTLVAYATFSAQRHRAQVEHEARARVARGAGPARRARAAPARPCRRTPRRPPSRTACGSRPRGRCRQQRAAASRAMRSASTPVSVLLPLPEGPMMSRRVPCAGTLTGVPSPRLAERQLVAREARGRCPTRSSQQVLLDELHGARPRPARASRSRRARAARGPRRPPPPRTRTSTGTRGRSRRRRCRPCCAATARAAASAAASPVPLVTPPGSSMSAPLLKTSERSTPGLADGGQRGLGVRRSSVATMALPTSNGTPRRRRASTSAGSGASPSTRTSRRSGK